MGVCTGVYLGTWRSNTGKTLTAPIPVPVLTEVCYRIACLPITKVVPKALPVYNNCQQILLYLAKLSFKIYREILSKIIINKANS
jgi:hypothetical protein